MGFISLCCEYVLLQLVNKETVLVYGRAEYSKGKNQSIKAEVMEKRRQSQGDTVDLPKNQEVR